MADHPQQHTQNHHQQTLQQHQQQQNNNHSQQQPQQQQQPQNNNHCQQQSQQQQQQQRRRIVPVAAPAPTGVAVTSLANKPTDFPGSGSNPPGNGTTPAAARPVRTLRLALHLSQSNERECPEFNYKELINVEEGRRRAEKEKRKGNPPNGIWDPFSDNDEDVERIAKQFEQKYGSSSTYGRSKGRCKQDDYADIGAGYDENDSFIDNTDGYDEIIPPECDTACGGFYINSGSLEFKNVTGTGLSTGEGAAGDSSPPTDRKSHKRPLSSSESEDESSSSEDDTEGSVVEKPVEINMKEIKTNSVTDSDKSGEDGKQSKIKKVKEDIPRKKRKNSQEGSASSGQETSNNKKSEKVIIENNVNVGLENNNEGTSDSRSSGVPSSDNHASSDSSRDASASIKQPPVVPSPDALPTDIPSELASLVRRLKDLTDSHFSSRTGKVAGPEVNEIILGLEMQCKRNKLSPRLRNALYAHAAQLLRRGKAGLMQRARRLAEDHLQNTVVSSPIDKLKQIIDKMKPSLLETYKVESQKIVEINKQIATQNAMLDDDKKIQERRLPKRRFPWNESVRSILQDVVQSRGFDLNESDERIVRFLQSVILPLFPTGFVRMPTLLQQVRNSKIQKLVTDVGNIKKPMNKSIEMKNTVISQPIVSVKSPVKNPNDCKTPDAANRSISDPEMLSMVRPKLKTQTSSICIGTDVNEQHSNPSKAAEVVCHKSDLVPVIDSEKNRENSIEIDNKNKQFQLHSENLSGLQSIPDNISISITSVFPKKCDSEKTSTSSPIGDKFVSVDSVIIKPEKLTQQPTKTSSESIITSSNLNSVIKTIESVATNMNTTQNQMVGGIKLKPTSSLLDKSTIAKIISSKNTGLEVINKYNVGDNLKSKISDKIPNKQFQDSSHSKKSKSSNIQALSDSNSYLGSTLIKSPNNQVLKSVSVVLTDNFTKPFYKTDNLVPNNKAPNMSTIINANNSQSKYKDSSFNGNQRDNGHQKPNLNANDYNHSFVKPCIAKTSDFVNMSQSVNNNSSSQKHHGSLKRNDGLSLPDYDYGMSHNVNDDQKKSSTKNVIHSVKLNSSPSTNQRNSVLNVDDSSSDDCVEIVSSNEQSTNKSFHTKSIDDRLSREELIRRQAALQAEKINNPREKHKSKINTVDAMKMKRDKWNSDNLSTKLFTHNEHSDKIVMSKKLPNYMKLKELVMKKSTNDIGVEIIDEVDPLQGLEDPLYNHFFKNSGNSETLSLIEDLICTKSDRITDTVPETSGVIHYEKDEKDSIVEQEIDINSVMRDLKELQDFQMRSDGNHQRLYEDPSNNICHTSSYSETENKIYSKHKDTRENLVTSVMFLR